MSREVSNWPKNEVRLIQHKFTLTSINLNSIWLWHQDNTILLNLFQYLQSFDKFLDARSLNSVNRTVKMVCSDKKNITGLTDNPLLEHRFQSSWAWINRNFDGGIPDLSLCIPSAFHVKDKFCIWLPRTDVLGSSTEEIEMMIKLSGCT